MITNIHSNRYRPAEDFCCNACVFGGEDHAEFCPLFSKEVPHPFYDRKSGSYKDPYV